MRMLAAVPFAAALYAQLGLDTLPMSPVLTKDGKTMFALNAGRNAPSISVIDVEAKRELSRTPVADAWLGMALTKDEKRLYVSGGSQAAIFEFEFADGKLTPARTFPVVPAASRKPEDFIGDVRLSPDGRLIYAADLYRNNIVVINPQSGRVIERWQTGRRPYRILFHPNGKSFFVSSWADGSVYQHRATDGEQLGVARLAPQPMDMAFSSRPLQVDEEGENKPFWKERLFVTAANTNAVYVLGITEGGDIKLSEVINIALSPRHPLGMTPTALSLSADEKTLYVACSDADAIAVVGIDAAKASLRGHVPAGSYPTGVREYSAGKLAILSGGDGSALFVDSLDNLPDLTKQVRAGSRYSDATLDVRVNPGAIENVVYILKNAGDEGPNQRKLAREFTLLDRVAMQGTSPIDGMAWAASAIVPPFTRLLLPNFLAGRGKKNAFQSAEPANIPAAGYLWSGAASAGLTVQNYGFAVISLKQATADGTWVENVTDPGLMRYTNTGYAGLDATSVTDTSRAKIFLEDIEDGTLPRLTLIRLGTADQDAALGRIVEGISKTPAWAKTVIFVAGTGPANTPTKGLVISPYTRRGGQPDSTAYTQASFARTIELLLGLKPMTQFDAAATPISGIFDAKGDTSPYQPVP